MKLKFPHTYVIIFTLILIAASLTWLFPGGEYTKSVNTVDGKEVKEMVFHYTESNPQTWQVFSAFNTDGNDEAERVLEHITSSGVLKIC